MTFSATEAAFEGFRVTRARPGSLLIWALVWLVGILAIAFVMVPIVMPFAAEIQSAEGDAGALSADASRAVTIAVLAAYPIGLLVQSLLAPAIYRAVLDPAQRSFGGLRLGRDEARILAVTFGIGAISLGLNAGGELLGSAARNTLGMAAAGLVGLVVSVATIWTSVRLSLVAPVTLQRHKISFSQGWAMTARHFWPLLGMMVLTLVMAVIVVMLLVLIAWPLSVLASAAAGGGGAAALGALAAAVLMLVLMPLGLALVSVLLWAPFASAARDLATV